MNDQVTAVLQRRNAELRYLPKFSMKLYQPSDPFVMQKVKTAWRVMWDEMRMAMVENGAQTDFKKGSGKLPNPEKTFSPERAAKAVKAGDGQRDSDGFQYARKAIIRRGLALNLNGLQEVSHPLPHLQEIVKRYPDSFCGKSVSESMGLDGAVTETDSDASPSPFNRPTASCPSSLLYPIFLSQ